MSPYGVTRPQWVKCLSWLLCVTYQGYIINKICKVTCVIHTLADISQWLSSLKMAAKMVKYFMPRPFKMFSIVFIVHIMFHIPRKYQQQGTECDFIIHISADILLDGANFGKWLPRLTHSKSSKCPSWWCLVRMRRVPCFYCPVYGAFDLGLAVSVLLPIVTGIFVLLWFQSRLT